ncbi:MAG: endonuclease/exonuclease/phosphatase family protein [Candidatus Dormibacteria bacterium]
METLTRTVRVASWNIHEGLAAHTTSGEPEITQTVDLLNQHKIDIIGLQEVAFEQNGDSPILDAILRGTELSHVASFPLSPSSFHRDQRAGVAIASRYELTEVERRFMVNPGLEGRVCGSKIESHDKGLIAANARLADNTMVRAVSLHAVPFRLFGRDANEPEFGSVWDHLASSLWQLREGMPLIVCGDFNTSDRNLILGKDIGGALVRTVGDRATYDSFAADDILVSREFRTQGTFVYSNFSDHMLCITELTLRRAIEDG